MTLYELETWRSYFSMKQPQHRFTWQKRIPAQISQVWVSASPQNLSSRSVVRSFRCWNSVFSNNWFHGILYEGSLEKTPLKDIWRSSKTSLGYFPKTFVVVRTNWHHLRFMPRSEHKGGWAQEKKPQRWCWDNNFGIKAIALRWNGKVLRLLKQQDITRQIFIEWIIKCYKGSRPLFLDGGNKDDITSCVMIANREVSLRPLLKYDHEEADNRLLLHANHALKFNNYKKLIIASSDTNVLVNVMQHFSYWMFSDLKELWVLSPNKASQKQVIPVHKFVEELDGEVANVLPALHPLTGTILNHICTIFWCLCCSQCSNRGCFRSRQSEVFWKVRVPGICRKSLKDTWGAIHS